MLFNSLLTSKNNSRGTVTDSRGVSSSDNTVGLENWSEFSESLNSCSSTRMLINRDNIDTLFRFNANRSDFFFEAALSIGCSQTKKKETEKEKEKEKRNLKKNKIK